MIYLLIFGGQLKTNLICSISSHTIFKKKYLNATATICFKLNKIFFGDEIKKIVFLSQPKRHLLSIYLATKQKRASVSGCQNKNVNITCVRPVGSAAVSSQQHTLPRIQFY